MDEMRHDSSIARWRQMTEADLPAVESVGRSVHASNPEDLGIYAERLALHPHGCFVLQGGERIIGYILSHPWLSGQPPQLNSFLERLPPAPDTFYVHDVALLPEARGAGAGSAGVDLLVRQAVREGFTNLSLVAVNGAAPFWQRHGFRVMDGAAIRPRLRSYGEAASFMVRIL